MALVALEPATRESRLAAAGARWAALLAARPDLEPAIALQRQLIGLVVDLAHTVEHGRLPRLSLPPRYLAAKLGRGVPVLAGEPIPLPVAALRPVLVRLCEELSAGGAGQAADNIKAAILETRIQAGSLLAASLARDQAAIRTGANHRGLAADLLWLVAELAVSPFAHALQRALLSPETAGVPSVRRDAAGTLGVALSGWTHGFCPACGSWPALAEVASSHRVLRCSFCAFAWELPVYACVYCGEAGERFVTAAPNEDRKDRRLEACGACSSYMKTVDVAELSPFPLLAIADLETMNLDMAAMERGYARPPLKDFTARR
jgi:FdhE protein